MSSSDLEACDREICIIIKELFYYLLINGFFACGDFIATTISGDATFVLRLKN